MWYHCVHTVNHKEHSLLNVGCLPNSLHLRQQPSVNITAREVLLYVPSPSTWAFSFFFLNRGYDCAGSAGNPLKRENKRSPLLWWSVALKRPDLGPDSTFHTIGRPTIQQTLPLQTYYCPGARHSCGESHLGVRGNKCFFNWNSGISSCFLPVLYESPVPIVWRFALTSPWRPRLIERVCVWTRFKRN